jgi:hypothetical protein
MDVRPIDRESQPIQLTRIAVDDAAIEVNVGMREYLADGMAIFKTDLVGTQRIMRAA